MDHPNIDRPGPTRPPCSITCFDPAKMPGLRLFRFTAGGLPAQSLNRSTDLAEFEHRSSIGSQEPVQSSVAPPIEDAGSALGLQCYALQKALQYLEKYP